MTNLYISNYIDKDSEFDVKHSKEIVCLKCFKSEIDKIYYDKVLPLNDYIDSKLSSDVSISEYDGIQTFELINQNATYDNNYKFLKKEIDKFTEQNKSLKDLKDKMKKTKEDLILLRKNNNFKDKIKDIKNQIIECHNNTSSIIQQKLTNYYSLNIKFYKQLRQQENSNPSFFIYYNKDYNHEKYVKSIFKEYKENINKSLPYLFKSLIYNLLINKSIVNLLKDESIPIVNFYSKYCKNHITNEYDRYCNNVYFEVSKYYIEELSKFYSKTKNESVRIDLDVSKLMEENENEIQSNIEFELFYLLNSLANYRIQISINKYITIDHNCIANVDLFKNLYFKDEFKRIQTKNWLKLLLTDYLKEYYSMNYLNNLNNKTYYYYELNENYDKFRNNTDKNKEEYNNIYKKIYDHNRTEFISNWLLTYFEDKMEQSYQ